MANNAVINLWFKSQGAIKQIDNFKQKMDGTVKSIQNSFAAKLGAVGTFAGTIATLKSAYTETLKLAQAAESFSLPVEEVSKFSNALKLVGGSTDDALSVLQTLQNGIDDLRINASGSLKEVATRMTIAVRNGSGQWKNALQLFVSLRKEFGHLNSAAQRDALKKLGIFSPYTLRILRMNNDEFAKLNQEATDTGVISASTAEKVLNLQRAFSKMWQIIKGVTLDLFGDALVYVVNGIKDGVEWLGKLNPETKKWVAGVVLAIGALSPLLSLVKMFATPLKALGLVFAFVGINIAGLTVLVGNLIAGLLQATPLLAKMLLMLLTNPIVLTLTAIAAAVYLIYSNWEKVAAVLPRIWESINELWEEFKEKLKGIGNWFKELGDGIGKFFKNLFNSLLVKIKEVLLKIPLIGKGLADEIQVNEDRLEDDINRKKYKPVAGYDGGVKYVNTNPDEQTSGIIRFDGGRHDGQWYTPEDIANLQEGGDSLEDYLKVGTNHYRYNPDYVYADEQMSDRDWETYQAQKVASKSATSNNTTNNYDNKNVTVNVYTNNVDDGRRLGRDVGNTINQMTSGVRQ